MKRGLTKCAVKESNLQPIISIEGEATVSGVNLPAAGHSGNPENLRTLPEARQRSGNKPTTRLSALSRLQVGTGLPLPQSSKCGLCDERSVAEIAGVMLCAEHERRVAEIKAADAGTSGRRPQVWAIQYKVAVA